MKINEIKYNFYHKTSVLFTHCTKLTGTKCARNKNCNDEGKYIYLKTLQKCRVPQMCPKSLCLCFDFHFSLLIFHQDYLFVILNFSNYHMMDMGVMYTPPPPPTHTHTHTHRKPSVNPLAGIHRWCHVGEALGKVKASFNHCSIHF